MATDPRPSNGITSFVTAATRAIFGAMTIYCLADLFNLRLWPRGRRPNLGDIRDGIGELVDEILGATTDAGEMTIRLFGGWYGPTLQSAETCLAW